MENLSNEIFYEIFDYLNGYEIYQAFSNLNIRFEKLVMNSSYSMKIEFSPTTIFNILYEQFLHSNKHRLISFHFNDEAILEQLITFVPMHLLFFNLQAIILKEISSFQLLIVLFYFKSSSRLTSLKVRLNDCFFWFRWNLSKYFSFTNIEISRNDNPGSRLWAIRYHFTNGF